MRGLAGQVADVISDTAARARDRVSDLVSSLVNRFAGLPGRAGNAIAGLRSAIAQRVADAGSWLRDAGRRIVRGLIDGMRDGLDDLRRNMTEIAGTVRDYWPFSPAKKGPLSGRGSPDLAGRNITRMLSDGIASGRPAIDAAMTGAMGGARAKGGVAVAAAPSVPVAGVTIQNLNINGTWDLSKPGETKRVAAAIYEELKQYERSRSVR